MTESVIEVIGGASGNGGLNSDDRSSIDADQEIKAPNVDPEIAPHVYGGVAIAKVIVACLLWFWYYEMGNSTKHPLTGYYYTTWLSAFLAVMLSWGPVMLFYFLSFIDEKKLRHAYMWVCMISVDGPMGMYFIPMVIVLIIYLDSKNHGLQV